MKYEDCLHVWLECIVGFCRASLVHRGYISGTDIAHQYVFLEINRKQSNKSEPVREKTRNVVIELS